MNILCAILLATLPSFFGQKLMVDQYGEVYPRGLIPGLGELANLVSSQQVAQAKIDIVREVQESTSREVNLVVETLTGVNAYAYVEDFVESLGGVAAVSTNATCNVCKLQIGARKEFIDGVSYSAQELYYYFSEPMNNTPYITFQSALTPGMTNEWEKVELQDTTNLGTAIIDGIEYTNAYKSVVWTLTELDKCFYRVQCKISAPQGDGSTFDIIGGMKINGEKGMVGSLNLLAWDPVHSNKIDTLTWDGGLLMKVQEYIPPQNEEE